jgi:hypothetical protein
MSDQNSLQRAVAAALVAAGAIGLLAMAPAKSSHVDPKTGTTDQSGVWAVMVKQGEVVLLTPRLETRPLTHGGGGKALPTWSKAGDRIAYVENAAPDLALKQLVIVDLRGAVLRQIPIHPAGPDGAIDDGMRSVESISWASPDRIVVAGSINPSTREVLVFDPATGKEIAQFNDDGFGPGFSGDGRHAAYVTGAPHFTLSAFRLARLVIDGESVFPEGDQRFDFASAPAWSPDDRAVAIVARGPSNTAQLVVWRRDGPAQAIPLDRQLGYHPSVAWSGADILVRYAKPVGGRAQTTLRIRNGSISEVEASPIAAALLLRSDQKRRTASERGVEPDFWCGSCALTILPSRNSLIDVP